MPQETAAERDTRMNAFLNAPEPAASPDPAPAPTPAAPTPVTAPTSPAAASGTPPATSGAPDAPAASTAQGGPSDWIVFKRGADEFKVPSDAAIEFKRMDQILTRTADDFRRDGMMGTDYQLRKAQIETERQALQREREAEAVERARMTERQRFLEQQERDFREAQTDPEKFERWQNHLAQLAQNPMYRKAFEDSLAKRETDAAMRVLTERAQDDYIRTAKATVDGWMDTLKAKYPGVPVETVRRDYAAQVALDEQRNGKMGVLGQGPLTPQALEAVFQHHAGVFKAAVEPVNARVAALEAELAALKANAQTEHAVSRAKTPSTAPVPGSPAKTDGRRTPKYETEAERTARMAAWVAEG